MKNEGFISDERAYIQLK